MQFAVPWDNAGMVSAVALLTPHRRVVTVRLLGAQTTDPVLFPPGSGPAEGSDLVIAFTIRVRHFFQNGRECVRVHTSEHTMGKVESCQC
jgi:hypothetical protein